MPVERCESRTSGKVSPISERNVSPIFLDEFLGISQIYQVNFGRIFQPSHAKIMRFYVSMQNFPTVEVFYIGDHLIHEHENSLEWKSSEDRIEEILKIQSKFLHHKKVEVSFSSRVVYAGDAFIYDLRVFVKVVV